MIVETDCPFCAIVRRETPDAREVYRDGHVVAFFPLKPATLGHILVVPLDHIPDIWSLDGETAAHLARVTLRLSHVVKCAIAPEGLNIIQSNGAVATQTVPHLHTHIVPRWSRDEMGRIWPTETSYSETQKDEVWERLRHECRKVGGE
ncbi:HIT family protein [Micromonospora sp. U21]|jgi:histidine triad (HIT) family protein|uniref:HIT family protein n=1 Tax=Micromonospora sp. U21 TaxID=2824899 RepID=UPI001B38D840|nr:HIT domain-containing protein [Micromonospora sp. U21]MBQ0906421.1 HIT domain-containing protein [Micromonospora sp. U21]